MYAEIDAELKKIIAQDNEAYEETDLWIKENKKLSKEEKTVTDATLPLRILDRLSTVQKAYEDYLFSHPDSFEGRLAYASFLADSGKDNEAAKQWKKMLEEHPNNAVLWNNMGNFFGQKGDAIQAFPYYEKAIELSPKEPLYAKNLGLVVYVFRQEAMDYYQLKEQQAIQLAQALFERALLQNPKDFVLATQLSQTWYYIKPFCAEKSMSAWQKAYSLASDDAERQGIMLHYARIELLRGNKEKADNILKEITLPIHQASVDELRKDFNIKTEENKTSKK